MNFLTEELYSTLLSVGNDKTVGKDIELFSRT